MPRRPFALLLASLALSISSCDPGGVGRSNGGTEKGEGPAGKPLRERLDAARAARTSDLKDELATAEFRVENLKAELEEVKKKRKAAGSGAVVTAKKEAEFRQQMADLDKKVAEATATRDRLKKDLAGVGGWEPEIDPLAMRTGDFGRLAAGGGVPIFTALQVIDRSNLIVTHRDSVFWVEGLSTADLADGKTFTVPGYVECPGNRQYESLTGTRTVMVIRLIGK